MTTCPISRWSFLSIRPFCKAGDSMKENKHKEIKQKPGGRLPKEQPSHTMPKTMARQVWLISKERVLSATKTDPEGSYATAQEIEEQGVRQGKRCWRMGRSLPWGKSGMPPADILPVNTNRNDARRRRNTGRMLCVPGRGRSIPENSCKAGTETPRSTEAKPEFPGTAAASQKCCQRTARR